MDIKDKAILPLRGFSYGPLDVEGQIFSVKMGKLICKPNMTFEEVRGLKCLCKGQSDIELRQLNALIINPRALYP